MHLLVSSCFLVSILKYLSIVFSYYNISNWLYSGVSVTLFLSLSLWLNELLSILHALYLKIESHLCLSICIQICTYIDRSFVHMLNVCFCISAYLYIYVHISGITATAYMYTKVTLNISVSASVQFLSLHLNMNIHNCIYICNKPNAFCILQPYLWLYLNYWQHLTICHCIYAYLYCSLYCISVTVLVSVPVFRLLSPAEIVNYFLMTSHTAWHKQCRSRGRAGG